MDTSIAQSATATFRWRSPLGASVGLFLAWGLLNAALAIYTPYTLHTGGVDALGGLILMADSDEALLGRTFASIDAQDPRLAAYLVAFMDTMCAQMMGFAVAYAALVWFGLRRGNTWSLWVAAVAGLMPFAYYLPILDLYARYSAPTGGFVGFLAVPVAAIGLATGLGRYGLRAAARGAPR
jgi:hypothetical protein